MLRCNQIPEFTHANKDELLRLSERWATKEFCTKMLTDLTEVQREILLLAYVMDATDQEIADVLGHTRRTVARWHKNARTTLSQRLGCPYCHRPVSGLL
jgi:RNA polymerase sigma factor (sigma-70 family)